MNRSVLWGMLCVPLVLPITAASGAKPGQAHGPVIRVEAPSETRAQWAARVGRSLTDQMVYPIPVGNEPYVQGLARVAFRCSEAGLPEDVRIVSSSGSSRLDRAALRAVQHIPTLHPLTSDMDGHQPIEAWLVFAADEENAQRLVSAAQLKAARSSLAQAGPAPSQQPVVLLASR